ncbi:neuropeptide F receptor [Exaiptasia diaphana]|uniref:G-protein coupled receptors family 1 profile domain-containing protein n=1 Tax=Exaiptasia diaphana TaxID=2652724 RepID=A0A913Y8W6_EXADI|nr:neuropeptide F receptor [Exaiptasia diaphana]XP_020916107.1 neuropeptide F receptor [Exaiptasia diaphana]XP_020916108.1 neuropeptide F receptor [Exaiptasia diaphana]XP_020916109.1 neuropeptide F receptor [Exaiptasia diaphana]XP_020916110.1 neuropeptide F receptor [Exaiptasia diaphana]KXJ28765.1 Neuropeptide FF receptor 2 [Exaiptasia diaphana]
MSNNTTKIIPLESIDGKVRLTIYITCLILGTIGCCIVLIALFTKKGCKWTDHRILLANLAVTDMTTIWAYVSVHFTLLSGNLYPSFCNFYPMLSVPLTTSIFTITSMAVIRYRRIVRMWSSNIKVITMIIWVICLWVASFLLLSPAMVVVRPTGRYCILAWTHPFQRKTYVFALFAFQYLIPLIIISAAYIGIGHNLKHYEGQVERENVKKENRDIIITLAIISVIFALFLMPLQIGSVMFEFGGISIRKFVYMFMNYSDIFALVHCCINPFVYGIVPREFRERYWDWTSKVLRTISRGSENTSYKISKPHDRELGRSRRSTNPSLDNQVVLNSGECLKTTSLLSTNQQQIT